MLKLMYYVSGHGLGHAIRSIEIVKALHYLAPEISVRIRTSVPRGVFEENLDPCPEIDPIDPGQSLDVGLVQHDCLRPDFKASLSRVAALLKQAPDIIRRERQILNDYKPLAVVADVPFLALAAARSAGVSSVAVGNFTWDWIYRHYAGLDANWQDVAEEIGAYYRQADLMIQLPLSPDMSPFFDRVVKVGLTGRKASLAPDLVRNRLGILPRARMILMTFNNLHLGPGAGRRLAENNPDCVFVSSGTLPLTGRSFLRVDSGRVKYPDLVGAADAIMTKPGYGIVADALANKTPIFYTDRGPFPEYPLLVRAIEDCLPHGYFPSEKLYEGNVRVDEKNLDPPGNSGGLEGNGDGARAAAETILKQCGWGGKSGPVKNNHGY